MLRKLSIVSLVALLLIAIAIPAFAAGVGSKTMCSVSVKGDDGWDSQTRSSATCQIDPWCYTPGESNVRYEPMPHSDCFSSIFLTGRDKKKPALFSTMSYPYSQNSEIQWNGVIQVGAKETRSVIEVRHNDDNYPVRHDWCLRIYDPNGVEMQETTRTDPGGYYTEKLYELPAIPGLRYTFTVTATPIQQP